MYSLDELKGYSIYPLREILRNLGGVPANLKKPELIASILEIQSGEKAPSRSNRGRRPSTPVTGDKINYIKDGFPKVAVSEDGTAEGEQPSAYQGKGSAASGILELHADGYGFLRGRNYETDGVTDVYVAKNVIRQYNLRAGDYIEGYSARTRQDASPSVQTVYKINGVACNKYKRVDFDDLTPYYPVEKLTMELALDESDLSLRAIDILCPIGKGQRGLIVAPPKAGKTTLIKKIAHSIEVNNPEVHLIVLLIDERPEEVTDLRRSVKSEVVASTFDEGVEHHVRLADLVLNRAKRLVETGKDVVVLLDSITKLTRAVNAYLPSSGKTLSGGIDVAALAPTKRFFGAARNVDGGGSLTVISTALIDTGSKMDDVIYEEFKGTGNMEIILSRELSEKRIFPAIDLYRSGTRRDELLLTKSELDCAYMIRRFLNRNDEASETLLDMLKKTANNKEFVLKVPTWIKMMTN